MLNRFLLLPSVLLLGLLSTANALEQNGTPDAVLPVIGNYGLDTPTRQGLKSIAPKGWNVYLHKQLILPDTMSWTAEDSFVSALTRMEQANGLQITVDWSKRAIYLNQGEKPMPVAPPVLAVAPRPAASLQTTDPVTPGVPVKAVDYVPQVGTTPAMNTPSTVPPIINEYAVAPGYAKEIAEKAAMQTGYSLSWEASPVLRTDRALTLFRNIDTDMKIILDALGGAYAGVSVQVYHPSKQVRVFSTQGVADAGQVTSSNNPLPMAMPSVDASQPTASSGVVGGPEPMSASTEPSTIPTVIAGNIAPGGSGITVPDVGPEVVLKLGDGDRLEEELGDVLKTDGFRLKWDAPKGLVSGSSQVFRADSVQALLRKILPGLGLQSDIFFGSDYNVVVIQPAEQLAY